MAKTLVTGGTGFIGSHLVRHLAARGDKLKLLVRVGRDTSHLDDLEWERAEGDVTDRDSVRRAMDGVSRVFNVAGTTSMRARDTDRVFDVNVGGTRNVMEEALRAGVVRVVHTSSCSAVGTAPPHGTIDETEPFKIGHLGISYVNSKHDAENVAMQVGARGLPVVIVNPAFVLGPDDPTGTSNALVTRLLLRRIPAYVDGGLNVVDVRDVAAGHLLADETGNEGERYLLAGRNFTLQRLFADLSRIGGVPPPPIRRQRHPHLDRARGARADPDPLAGQRRRGPLGDAVVDLLQREGRRRASGGSRARTRRPSRTRSATSSNSSGPGLGATGSPMPGCASRAPPQS